MNHTPGPWDFDGCSDTGKPSSGDNCRYHQIDAPTPEHLATSFHYTVADTMNRHHCISPEEDSANARLIAAAPELLAACKAQHEALDILMAKVALLDPEFRPSKSVAWAAVLQGHETIAKAEGRT